MYEPMLFDRDTSRSIISFTFFSLPEMARITYHFFEPSAMTLGTNEFVDEAEHTFPESVVRHVLYAEDVIHQKDYQRYEQR